MPAEAAFRWRVLGGILFLLLFTPFLTVSLAAPELTGAAGARVAADLEFWLGRSAWILPVLTLAAAMAFLETEPGRVRGLYWGGPVLFLDLVVLAARMGGQGGTLGGILDGALVHAVGPVGAWLLAAGGFLAGLALLWQATMEDLLQGLLALGRVLEGLALATGALLLAALRQAGRAGVRAWRRVSQRKEAAPGRRVRPPAVPPEEVARPAPRGLPPFIESLEEDAPGEESVEDPGFADSFPSEDPFVDFGSGEAPAGPAVEEVAPPEEEATPPWSEDPAATLPPVEGDTVEVALPAPAAGSPAPPPAPGSSFDDGVLEEPSGQLRLFPAPAVKAAAPLRYRLPPLSLLDDGPRHRRTRPLEDKSQVLVDTLDSFGVQARVVNVVQGPTVTRYELQPARGVKVSKFTSLTNDIALALAAVSVRIEAPIPGKSAIGIEVPNLSTELVVLKDLLATETFRRGGGLCLGLGKDISGGVQVADLQKMPHLLVAGTTGSGKSVCVNTLILSLIYRFTPRRLQMLMVDPKQVELSVYEGLPHLVGLSGEDAGRILVDPKKAAMALKQVVDLMEDRYTLFARCRVRNLKEYNDQAEEPLPWMVVIIDELADLMMVAAKTVETSICRLAQKARAAGIHLVVATQRPSTDVITGLIKVNIPSRIAFAVSSGVDSRVILDTGGAENLLGKGDMLFLPVDASEPRRIQGAYVTNEEIQRVVEFWREQAAPENRIELEVAEASADDSLPEGEDDGGDDDLVEEALQVVLRTQQASASMLQTELKVGYARARRILTILERKGWVGPAEGSKPRKILYTGGDL